MKTTTEVREGLTRAEVAAELAVIVEALFALANRLSPPLEGEK